VTADEKTNAMERKNDNDETREKRKTKKHDPETARTARVTGNNEKIQTSKYKNTHLPVYCYAT
jgi:hypothetical protein